MNNKTLMIIVKLRDATINWWQHTETASKEPAEAFARLLQPFDKIIEPPWFCRLPCNNRDVKTNVCSRKKVGLTCQWHSGYD